MYSKRKIRIYSKNKRKNNTSFEMNKLFLGYHVRSFHRRSTIINFCQTIVGHTRCSFIETKFSPHTTSRNRSIPNPWTNLSLLVELNWITCLKCTCEEGNNMVDIVKQLWYWNTHVTIRCNVHHIYTVDRFFFLFHLLL